VLDLEAIAHEALHQGAGDRGVVLDDKNLHGDIVACD